MLIQDALNWAINQLENSSTPGLDARLLLEYCLQYSREELILNMNNKINSNQLNNYHRLVKRRQKFEPIAYIIKKQEFYGLDFVVNQDVLIPRPETEQIVDLVKEHIKINRDNYNNSFNILELGTGSCAISVSIAKEVPKTKILATDISDKALKIAKINISNHKVQDQITLAKSDWYSSLSNKIKYDFILSNPPYICISQKDEMSYETILYEPQLALYADEHGLSAYKCIIKNAKNFLKKEGIIILEIGYSQQDQVADILNQYNLNNIITYRDLAGLSRIIVANL